ncbi:MAG: hypothetical protein FWD73_15255 [Polyangiaceae bacterium]|nr:hypothetical protein [Polyangiaceae bacterium]
MVKRKRNLVAKCSDEEMNMLHRICDDSDVSISFFVRALVRIKYGMRFGLDAPPPATLKHGSR